MKKRIESGDYWVCAAHDLAPIFEKGLGIRAKDFEKDKEFIRLVRTSGLELNDGQSWMGLLGKRGSVPKQKGGKKKNQRGPLDVSHPFMIALRGSI